MKIRTLEDNEGMQEPNSVGNHKRLPIVITPETDDEKSIDALVNWIESKREWFDTNYRQVGAFLFRGFDVKDAHDFERVGQCVTKDGLVNTYLGTSPRLPVTKYVFNASEFPYFFPIPQHLEMSFLPASMPKKILFCCLHPTKENTGETAISDFRAVAAQMDPKIRKEFEEKKVSIIRSYYSKYKSWSIDPFATKKWEEIYDTNDKQVLRDMSAKDDTKVTFDHNDRVTLINTHDAIRKHTETGEEAWSNHMCTLSLDAFPLEYYKASVRQNSWFLFFLCYLAAVIAFFKKLFFKNEQQALHATFGNGESIEKWKVAHIHDLVWKNTVFFSWKKGDIMCLDNQIISHGRMPYSGKRSVVTCFSC